MNFYVASPAIIIEEAREVIKLVKETGHRITFDWTHMKEDGGQGVIRESWKEHPSEGTVHSSKEREAIRYADKVILILPEVGNRGLGCFIEFGIAMGMCKPVWVLGRHRYPKDSVFFYLPEVRFLEDKELRPKLEELR